MLDTAHTELLDVFEDMKEHNLDDALVFFVTRQQRQQAHPYRRRPRSVRIQSPPPPFTDDRRTRTSSQGTTPAGTQYNPINVDDDEQAQPSPSSSEYVTAAEETVRYIATAEDIFRRSLAPSSSTSCTTHHRHSFEECPYRPTPPRLFAGPYNAVYCAPKY